MGRSGFQKGRTRSGWRFAFLHFERDDPAEGSGRKRFPLSLAQGSRDFRTVTLTFARPCTPARPFVARLSKPIGVYKIPQLRELKLPRKNRACGKEKPQAVYTLGARGACCLNSGSLGRAAWYRGMGSRPVGLKLKICSALGSCNAASCRNVNRCGHVSTQTE
jgi:hypothetical protein